jgi:hypothetical protein
MYTQTQTDLDHDYMVGQIVSHLRQKNFQNICADHLERFRRPELIYWSTTKEGYIPDVSATGTDGTPFLFEVESAVDLASEHAQSQRRLFSANATQHSKRFVLVVQADHRIYAESLVRQEGVQAEIWTVNQGAG